MKKFLLFSLVFMGLNTTAQYHPIAEQGKTWNILAQPFSGSSPNFTVTFDIDGDTLINGTPYPLMWGSDNRGWPISQRRPVGYWTEDTTNKITTYNEFSGHAFDFDFDLNVNDTFYMIDPPTGDSIFNYVTQISNMVDQQGNIRNQINFFSSCKHDPSFPSTGNYVWTEGLGSLQHLFWSRGHCVSTEVLFTTLCITDSAGNFLYQDPSFNTCNYLSEVEEANISFKLYPNPTSNFLTLEHPTLEPSTKFEIYTMQGQKVWEGELIDQTIDVSALAEGLYWLKSSHQYLGKFLKRQTR